jgi:hypothetical protein
MTAVVNGCGDGEVMLVQHLQTNKQTHAWKSEHITIMVFVSHSHLIKRFWEKLTTPTTHLHVRKFLEGSEAGKIKPVGGTATMFEIVAFVFNLTKANATESVNLENKRSALVIRCHVHICERHPTYTQADDDKKNKTMETKFD